MSGTWAKQHVIVLIAFILLVLAFISAMAWWPATIHNTPAWATAGLAVFTASFLPWRTAP